MLVLASVTISLVIGDNGLFNKAKVGTEAYKKQGIKEEIQNAIVALNMDYINEGLSNEIIAENLPLLVDNLTCEPDLTGECAGYAFHINDKFEAIIDGKANGLIVEIEKTGTEGEENWFKGEVSCTLTCTYKKAEIDKVYYSLDNGANFIEGTTFSVSNEGVNKVQYKAVAKDGAESKVYENQIKIDNTVPEITANQDSLDKTKINVKVTDENGIEVTNPDGTTNKLKEYTYSISENDAYIFNVKDLAGNSNQATVNVVNIIPRIVDVCRAGNEAENLFVKAENGDIYIAGANYCGQLCDGTTNFDKNLHQLKLPDDEGGVKVKPIKISAYGSCIYIIGDNNDLYYCGDNAYGLIGNGTTSTLPLGFTKTYLNSSNKELKAKDIILGNGWCYAIGTDDKVYAWGRNSFGAIGQGKIAGTYSTPCLIDMNGHTPKKIINTGCSVAILCTDNTLFAMGWQAYGVLGNGNANNASVNYLVSMSTFLKNVTPVDLFCTSYAVFVLGNDDNLYATGMTSEGVFGSSSIRADSNSPYAGVVHTFKKIPLPVGISKIAFGDNHVLMIGTDNKFYGWGWNATKELADPSANTMEIREMNLPNGISATDVYTFCRTSIAKGSDGKYYSWGSSLALGRPSNGHDYNMVKIDFSE